jgi:hypothetical protein
VKIQGCEILGLWLAEDSTAMKSPASIKDSQFGSGRQVNIAKEGLNNGIVLPDGARQILEEFVGAVGQDLRSGVQ